MLVDTESELTIEYDYLIFNMYGAVYFNLQIRAL